MLGNQPHICPGCRKANKAARDIWKCLYCPSQVCDWCYHEHTDKAHLCSLYPFTSKLPSVSQKYRWVGSGYLTPETAQSLVVRYAEIYRAVSNKSKKP